MFIQTETTPNPATLKFLPGQTVLDRGTADFTESDAAAVSPLAARVFPAGMTRETVAWLSLPGIPASRPE